MTFPDAVVTLPDADRGAVQVVPRPGSGWQTVALGAAWLVCATVLQLVRAPGTPSWDTLWQEDGGIFLTDALHHHLLDALTRPYNGYLHMVPRLLAGAAVHLPLRDAAWCFAVSSALVVSAVSLYVFWASRLLVPAVWARGLIVVLVVLAPVSAYETGTNINNLHWYLVFACAWVPWSAPRGRAQVALSLAVVAAATLSDSEVVLLAPLFLPLAWQGLRQRRRVPLLVTAVLGACLLVQFLAGAQGQQPGRYDLSRWADVPGIFGLRVASSLLVGDRYLVRSYVALGSAYWVAALVLLGVLLVGAAALAPAARPALAVTTVYGVVFLVVPVMLRGTAHFLTRPGTTLNGSRYALLPVLFLASGLLTAAARLGPRLVQPDGRVAVLPSLLSLLTVTVVVANFADVNVRGPGPSWRLELDRAAAVCARTGDAPRERATSADNPYGTLTVPTDVVVPVAPSLPHVVPFAVVLDCRQLRKEVPAAGLSVPLPAR